MSYILDALKKSEKERPAGAVPDLHTIQQTPAPEVQKSRWPYVVGGALLLNAVVISGIFFMYQPDEPGPPHAPSTTPAANQQVAAAVAPLPLAPGPASSAMDSDTIPAAKNAAAESVQITPASDAGAGASTEQLHLLPHEDRAPQEAPGIDEPLNTSIATAAPAESVEEFSEEILMDPTEENSMPTSGEEEKAVVDTQYAGEDLSENSQAGASEEAAPPQTPSASASEIKKFHQLPESVRKGLPEITISALFYSAKPSSRLASVNGKILREGQPIADNLLLKEIKRDGVVLTHKDQTFFLEVF